VSIQVEKIIAEFPVLGRAQGETRAERYSALEEIEPNVRLKIDRFASLV